MRRYPPLSRTIRHTAHRAGTVLALLLLLTGLIAMERAARGAGIATPVSAQVPGDCGVGYAAKLDGPGPVRYTAPPERVIARVIVKAGSPQQGQACFPLTPVSPSDACYVARFSKGSAQVEVSRNGAFSGFGRQVCKDISHVEIYLTTPPVCGLAILPGPPKQVQVKIQSTEIGLRSIEILVAINTDVLIPPFKPGTTDPVVVVGTKIDEKLVSQLALWVTDMAGNSVECDPVLVTVRVSGVGRSDADTVIVTGVPQAEGIVRVTNGVPGLHELHVTVNGRLYQLTQLRPGEVRSLDVSAAMRPGSNNTFVLTPFGPPGASAEVLIWDGQSGVFPPIRGRSGVLAPAAAPLSVLLPAPRPARGSW